MRLINNHHEKPDVIVDPSDDLRHALIIGDCHAACLLPLRESALQLLAVKKPCLKSTELSDLPAPVDKNSRRADNKSMASLFLRIEVRHRSDRLDRLAKTHVISKKHPLLMEDILYPEFLISAQVSGKASQIRLK